MRESTNSSLQLHLKDANGLVCDPEWFVSTGDSERVATFHVGA